MKKFLSLPLVLLFVVTALVAFSPSANAHPLSTQGQGCAHWQVYLNNSVAATAKCLDTSAPTSTRSASTLPNIGAVPCDEGSLILYADSGYSGWTLCLKGSGATDLGIYHGPAPYYNYTWNDLASSYITGCSDGTFYADSGESGPSDYVNNERHNFDGLNGRLSNDTLSSVRLYTVC